MSFYANTMTLDLHFDFSQLRTTQLNNYINSKSTLLNFFFFVPLLTVNILNENILQFQQILSEAFIYIVFFYINIDQIEDDKKIR
jgi:hypothetical protein